MRFHFDAAGVICPRVCINYKARQTDQAARLDEFALLKTRCFCVKGERVIKIKHAHVRR